MYSQEQLEETVKYLQKENIELKNRIDHLQRVISELYTELQKNKPLL
jgi:prefoldin subunit 5